VNIRRAIARGNGEAAEQVCKNGQRGVPALTVHKLECVRMPEIQDDPVTPSQGLVLSVLAGIENGSPCYFSAFS
jgi:hypothetical protein